VSVPVIPTGLGSRVARLIYSPKGIGRGKKQMHEKFMTPEEWKALVHATHDATSYGEEAEDLFCTTFVLGLRLEEAMDLTYDDFRDLGTAGAVHVRRLKKRDPTKSADTVYLGPEEARMLGRILERRRRYSPRGPKLFNFSGRKGQYLFAYYAGQAGVLATKPRLSFHSIRHTATIDLWEASKDFEFVRARLGHANFKWLHVYIHTHPERQKQLAANRTMIRM